MKTIKYDLQLFYANKFNIVEESQSYESVNQEGVSNSEPIDTPNTIEILSKFDSQLTRISQTLNAFENQLQNVDRQIKDLESLASKNLNPEAKTTTKVSLAKSTDKTVNLEKSTDKTTEKQEAAAQLSDRTVAKSKSLIQLFNEKISGVQNIKDFAMTTAKNLYFASIPLLMFLTAMMPTETKNFLTKVEKLKGNVTETMHSDASYTDKIKSVGEIAGSVISGSDESQVTHLEKNKTAKTLNQQGKLKNKNEGDKVAAQKNVEHPVDKHVAKPMRH
jgi:hypothetical protein